MGQAPASPGPVPPPLPGGRTQSAEPAPRGKENDHEENLNRQMLQDLLGHVRQMAIRQVELASGPRNTDAEKENLVNQLTDKDRKMKDIEDQFKKTLEELQRKSSELEKAAESEAAAKARLEQEKLRHDSAGEKLSTRYRELERTKDDLEERMRQLSSAKGQLEAAKDQADKQAREALSQFDEAREALRRLEAERASLQGELATTRERAARLQEEAHAGRRGVEQETRDLRCRAAVLEDQLHDTQEKLQQERLRVDQERQRADRAEQELERMQQEASQWPVGNFQQESLIVQQKINNELKGEVCRLERLLSQERSMHSIMSPADFFALHDKQAEDESALVAENERLRRSLMRTQCELDDAVSRLRDAMQRASEATPAGR